MGTIDFNSLLDVDSTPPLNPIPIFIEVISGAKKGEVGFTYKWEFPMCIFDDLKGTEFFITSEQDVKEISREEYEKQIKEKFGWLTEKIMPR